MNECELVEKKVAVLYLASFSKTRELLLQEFLSTKSLGNKTLVVHEYLFLLLDKSFLSSNHSSVLNIIFIEISSFIFFI